MTSDDDATNRRASIVLHSIAEDVAANDYKAVLVLFMNSDGDIRETTVGDKDSLLHMARVATMVSAKLFYEYDEWRPKSQDN